MCQPKSPAIAVVGCGHWGRNLVRIFHNLGSLAAVSDIDPEKSNDIAHAHGVANLPIGDILSDADIDGLVIAVPAQDHAQLCRQGLRATKHIFVEKPLALSTDEAQHIIDDAAQRDRVVMVGHLLRYHPAFVRLQELVSDGELGRLQYVYSHRLNLGIIRRHEDVFWSFAPHDISMILGLAGCLPASVWATGAKYLHGEIADVTTTHMTFADGLHAHIFVSWLHPFKEQKLVVIGQDAMAVFDDQQPWSHKLALYRHRVRWRDSLPEPERADPDYVHLEAAEPLRLECQRFLESMVSGKRPETDANEGTRVLRVLTAASLSMQTARPVDPQILVGATRTSGKDGHCSSRDGIFVHESAYVDEGCTLGFGTCVWHFSHILPNSRIGRDCTIGQNVMIGPDVSVGDRCKIQNNVSVYKGVKFEDEVFCGPSCVFTNVLNPRAGINRKDEFRPTLVRTGATIGANATILCGITLGAYSFVAAGAVVTHDVPPHALVAGVPARRIAWVSHAGERLSGDLTCPRSGRRYHELDGDTLVEATNEDPVITDE